MQAKSKKVSPAELQLLWNLKKVITFVRMFLFLKTKNIVHLAMFYWKSVCVLMCNCAEILHTTNKCLLCGIAPWP